jgi:hypothetical protein
MHDLPKPERRRSFTPKQRNMIATRQEWLCNVCKVDLCGIAFDIDHVQRLDALGKHEPENWQALCKPCHAIKTKTDNREAKKGRRIRHLHSPQICPIEECGRPSVAIKGGLCRAHRIRKWRYGDPLGGGPHITPPGLKMKFIEEALECQHNDCLEWEYPYNLSTGYPEISIDDATVSAHRYVCRKAHGEPAEEKLVAAHNCGNRRCMNPNHLRWATYAENEADKHLHGTSLKGKPGRMIKLTEEDLIAIRALRGVKPQHEIAKEYGVHQVTISEIQTGKYGAWAGTGPKKAIPSRPFGRLPEGRDPKRWQSAGFNKSLRRKMNGKIEKVEL